MYRIATQELKDHVGKLVGVNSGPEVYVGTLKGRGARISSARAGRVDSTWIVQTRWKDVEFQPATCEIYSMQYEPVGSAWWLG